MLPRCIGNQYIKPCGGNLKLSCGDQFDHSLSMEVERRSIKSRNSIPSFSSVIQFSSFLCYAVADW